MTDQERKFVSGYKAATHKFEEQQASAQKFNRRFWLPKKKSARVIFLTDKPVIVEEHSVPTRDRNGKRRFNPVTSPASFGERDPLKDAGSRTATVAYYTILDLTEWKDRNGKPHTCEKRLLGVKAQAFEVIKRRRAEILSESDRQKNLVGALFKVYRSSADREPSTGSDWQFVKHVSKARMLKLLQAGAQKGQEVTLDPLDYEKMLAPPPLAELKQLARRLEASQGGDEEEVDEELEEERPRKHRLKAKRSEVEDEDEEAAEDLFTEDEDAEDQEEGDEDEDEDDEDEGEEEGSSEEESE